MRNFNLLFTIILGTLFIFSCSSKPGEDRKTFEASLLETIQSQDKEQLSAYLPEKEILLKIGEKTSRKKESKKIAETPDESLLEIKDNSFKVLDECIKSLEKKAINSSALEMVKTTINENEKKGLILVDLTYQLKSEDRDVTLTLRDLLKFEGTYYFYFDTSIKVDF